MHKHRASVFCYHRTTLLVTTEGLVVFAVISCIYLEAKCKKNGGTFGECRIIVYFCSVKLEAAQ